MNLPTWLHQTGLLRPDAPALRRGEALHGTYSEFARRSGAVGDYLQSRFGIRRGDRVALFAKNSAEYLEVLYGVLWIGAIIVPINHKLHPREAAWIIGNAEASLVFTDDGATFTSGGDVAANCREIGIQSEDIASAVASGARDSYCAPVAVADDEIAWLFYTSGTTGRPKGVMTTHRNLRMMATSYALDVDSVSWRDHVLYAAPMSHGAGLYNFQFVRAGACHVIPESQGFDCIEIQKLAESLGSLVFFAAPTMIMRLMKHAREFGYRGEGIRTIVYGGGPMYLADINEALALFGPRFAQIRSEERRVG